MSYYPDFSAYYAAAAASPFTAAAAVRLAAASPPMKRARVVVPAGAAAATAAAAAAAAVGAPRTVIAKSPATPPARRPQGTVCLDDLHQHCGGQGDIMICGNCRQLFHSIGELLLHKKDYCKLRFACKCSHDTHAATLGAAVGEAGSMLLCGICADPFDSAWRLLEHFQDVHGTDIYQLNKHNDAATAEGAPPGAGDTTSRAGSGSISAAASDGASSGLELEDGSEEGNSDEDDNPSSGDGPACS